MFTTALSESKSKNIQSGINSIRDIPNRAIAIRKDKLHEVQKSKSSPKQIEKLKQKIHSYNELELKGVHIANRKINSQEKSQDSQKKNILNTKKNRNLYDSAILNNSDRSREESQEDDKFMERSSD